eukprot:COSAG02_NODE_7633_length_2924_cov_2.074336_3_plen_51_part_00
MATVCSKNQSVLRLIELTRGGFVQDGMGGGDILKSNIIFNMVRETQGMGM